VEIRKAELGELQSLMRKELEEYYPSVELKGIINGLFSHLTGLTTGQMVLEKEKRLTESEIHFLQLSLKRLKNHEPLQYITGTAYFHGLDFKVSPAVLIPRPETEELVEWIVQRHGKANGSLSILDIGTGSGCIAISLKAKMPEAMLFAIDISEKAITVARKNAHMLGTEVFFGSVDILDGDASSALLKFDIIVSNPPYVTPADREKMLPNVTDHEPALALFVEEDPLIFYKEIITFSEDHLAEGGSLYFECNESNATEVADLLNQAGFKNVEVRKDMQGKDRMVLGTEF
jgi:release factor glutamine methyltransferase